MDWVLPNARKGEVWREGRKLLNHSLRPGATMSYRQMMLENTHGFLARLLATPEEFLGHIGLSVAILLAILILCHD
jgi:cytochrome P450